LAANEPAPEGEDPGVEEEAIELVSSPRQPRDMPTDSRVDLGGPEAEIIEDDSGSSVQEKVRSESDVFVAGPESEAGAVEPVSDSGLDLHEAEAISAEHGGSSVVDLGVGPIEDIEASSPVEAFEESEARGGSGIDLEASPVPGVSPSDSSNPTSDSAVDLEAEAQAPSARSSLEGVEEPAVSEKEVDDLLADLEESPGAGEAAGEAADFAEGQEALAAVEAEEETAAAEAKGEEKPAKTAKQPSRIPALAGASLLGILLGAGGTIGTQSLMGTGEKPKTSAQPPMQPAQQAAVPPAAPTTFDSLQAMVAHGDWEGANKAGIDNAPANKPEELVVRGQYRLGQYLQKFGHIFSNEQDPNLQPAIQDLKQAAEANNPDAAYDLAFIKELAGNLQEARQEYAKGAQNFASDPAQKQRFETAISRVQWKESLKVPKRPGKAMLPLPRNAEERAEVLAVLLVNLQPSPQPNQQPAQQNPQPAQQGQQPPQQGQQPAQADNKEAGFEFWQAAKLAHEGKFSDAVQTLEKARALHDQRRFSRLRKAQNPLSDPAEDIFLRCCEELKTYWQLENRLREGGYLTDKNTPAEALQALVQKADTGAGASKNVTDQLVAAKILGKDEDVSKGITRLINAKKEAEANLADLKMMLQTAKDENTKLDGKLKTAEKGTKERDADLTKAKEQNASLRTDFDKVNATLTKVRDELTDAKFLDAKENISDAVKRAIDVAKSKDTQGTIRQQSDQIVQLSAALKQSRRTEEMLPLWLLLLEENRNRTDLAEKAAKDAERVRTDPRATAMQKGEAEVVLGLAMRNTDQFSKAKLVLQAAHGSVDQGEWLAHADAALGDVSNPAAYLTSQARLWYDHGRMETALDLLKRAEKALPAKEHAKLWAQRSLIELDAARTKNKGTLPPMEPLLIAARKDAEEAAKAGSAAGHYALGRITEELGQSDAAIKNYRAAVAAQGNNVDTDGSRYRMALARLLLQSQAAVPNQPAAPAKGGAKVSRRAPTMRSEDLRNLVILLMLGMQMPATAADVPGQSEAEKLANEVLKAPPGTVPFNVLAQALAVRGRWDSAWQTYVEGLRPILPREYGEGLAFLLRNDPRLQRPGSLRTSNPMEADKHFAAGLNFFYNRDYVNAEKEFLLAVEADSQDARFFYYLGLSRLAQNRRRDAFADFRQAVLLERLHRPSQAAVDESLERVQGPLRRIVNETRQSPEG
jgi:hypothetical protein